MIPVCIAVIVLLSVLLFTPRRLKRSEEFQMVVAIVLLAILLLVPYGRA